MPARQPLTDISCTKAGVSPPSDKLARTSVGFSGRQVFTARTPLMGPTRGTAVLAKALLVLADRPERPQVSVPPRKERRASGELDKTAGHRGRGRFSALFIRRAGDGGVRQ